MLFQNCLRNYWHISQLLWNKCFTFQLKYFWDISKKFRVYGHFAWKIVNLYETRWVYNFLRKARFQSKSICLVFWWWSHPVGKENLLCVCVHFSMRSKVPHGSIFHAKHGSTHSICLWSETRSIIVLFHVSFIKLLKNWVLFFTQ